MLNAFMWWRACAVATRRWRRGGGDARAASGTEETEGLDGEENNEIELRSEDGMRGMRNSAKFALRGVSECRST